MKKCLFPIKIGFIYSLCFTQKVSDFHRHFSLFYKMKNYSTGRGSLVSLSGSEDVIITAKKVSFVQNFLSLHAWNAVSLYQGIEVIYAETDVYFSAGKLRRNHARKEDPKGGGTGL